MIKKSVSGFDIEPIHAKLESIAAVIQMVELRLCELPGNDLEQKALFAANEDLDAELDKLKKLFCDDDDEE